MNFIKENKGILTICISAFIIVLAICIKQRIKDDSIERTELELKNYQVNEVIPVYVSDEELAKKYLSNFVSLSIVYPDKAYELLSNESKERYQTIDSFKDFIYSLNKNKSFSSARVKEYSYTRKNNSLRMYIIDIENNKLVFEQQSIMEYIVTIN